jgi:hypothetical protein
MLKVFSIYDEKAEAYLPPFFLPTTAMATRVFADCVNSETHQFGANPHDYTLFELGQFDDERGDLLPQRAKQPLGNGVEFRKPDHPISPELGNVETSKGQQQIGNGSSVQSSTSSENPAK